MLTWEKGYEDMPLSDRPKIRELQESIVFHGNAMDAQRAFYLKHSQRFARSLHIDKIIGWAIQTLLLALIPWRV